MINEETFDYSSFLSKSGGNLVTYSMLFLSDLDVRVPNQQMDLMCESLDLLDEEHLVFAIEICTTKSPEKLVSRLPDYLSHTSTAVFSAAERGLRHLPDSLVDSRLVTYVKHVLANLPDRSLLVGDLQELLREKLNRKCF